MGGIECDSGGDPKDCLVCPYIGRTWGGFVGTDLKGGRDKVGRRNLLLRAYQQAFWDSFVARGIRVLVDCLKQIKRRSVGAKLECQDGVGIPGGRRHLKAQGDWCVGAALL